MYAAGDAFVRRTGYRDRIQAGFDLHERLGVGGGGNGEQRGDGARDGEILHGSSCLYLSSAPKPAAGTRPIQEEKTASNQDDADATKQDRKSTRLNSSH